MAHAFSALYCHLVFSTKERRSFLADSAIRTQTHHFLGGIAHHNDAQPIVVGGVEDHVHLLLRLGRTIAVADLVRELKRGSSVWIKDQDPSCAHFAWQSGYAALSVSPKDIDLVGAYVETQAEHHRKASFQDEYRKLLEEHGIELDERYMWE